MGVRSVLTRSLSNPPHYSNEPQEGSIERTAVLLGPVRRPHKILGQLILGFGFRLGCVS